MFEPLQRWRDEFARDPDAAFDRLVRGVVPLGAAGQLTLGEILDAIFEPGDTDLDTAATTWLQKHILAVLPEHMAHRRWVAVLVDFFRAIETMELPGTNETLRAQHKRIRPWLTGFYAGSDRDPEGAFLIALAHAQSDQNFSPLWRRLILGQELPGRHYQKIGIFGFRKMPDQDGRPSADVPPGLIQALVAWADRPGAEKPKWKQAMRSLFAAYPRREAYWIDRLAPLLSAQQSHARDWLSPLLPGLSRWHASKEEGEIFSGRVQPVPRTSNQQWAASVRQHPEHCDSAEFTAFLDQHRAYVRTTGDVEYIGKTFNNLAMGIVRADQNRAALAIALMEEALTWDSSNPHNWTSYAIVLDKADRSPQAIDTLWQARQRFAWDPFIRNELARLLRVQGDLIAAQAVFREAISHFPGDVVCRGGLADLLVDLDEMDEAERLFHEVLEIDEKNQVARGGLARAWSIRSAGKADEALRDRAKQVLRKLADEGNRDAEVRLNNFDEQWQQALGDPSIKFRRETQPGTSASQLLRQRSINDMSGGERLGRAMIALWQAERADDPAQRAELCGYATGLLDFSEEQLDHALLTAFVDTRGLILLVSGDADGALAYFDEQISRYGRSGWMGVYLGRKRARMMLGQPDDEAVEEPTSSTARYALLVAQVIQVLSSSSSEAAVRELLKTLYPKAARFSASAQTDNSIKSSNEMLFSFVQSRWFKPAGIQSVTDFDQAKLLKSVTERIQATQVDAFDVISNATLPMTA